MQPTDGTAQLVPLNPELFGPLGQPGQVVHVPPATATGDSSGLSPRQRSRRTELRAALDGTLRRLLAEGEQVAWIAPAVHVPRLLEAFGLGIWYRHFFRVALVFTDRRLIEVMLAEGGRRPGTRTLSFPWAEAKHVRHGPLSLIVAPRRGRTQKWRLAVRADRKIATRLAPLVVERVAATAPAEARSVPIWHCPSCAAEVAPKAGACAACGTSFRSRGQAIGLAFAFPGAGLFYTGHPVLGVFDLLGELVLAAVIAVLLLASSAVSETLAIAAGGLLLFALTKLESAHLADLFASRTTPEDPAHRQGWRRFAIVGAALSAFVIAAPLVMAGALVNRIDRDLVFHGEDFGWSGGLDPEQWQFSVNEGQRSEWVLDDGQSVFVSAFPLAPFESFSSVRAELEQSANDPLGPIEEFTIGTLSGLRLRERYDSNDGGTLIQVWYVVFDRANRDLHSIITHADPELADAAEADLRDLLETAEWVAAAR